MGTKRSGAKGSFVSTVTAALDTFYADVVENIRPWTPPAPQLPTPETTDAHTTAVPTPIQGDPVTAVVEAISEPSLGEWRSSSCVTDREPGWKDGVTVWTFRGRTSTPQSAP